VRAKAEAIAELAPTPLDDLARLLEGDLSATNALILERLDSPVGLIPDLAAHLIDAGGKRLRPMITLAAAGLFGQAGRRAHCLAAAVEFIHSATLLHDDVVDESDLRRGRRTAHRIWGNSASVLVGDFLFARSFNLMVETGDLRVLDILARAASVIAEGEVMQLAAVHDAAAELDHYLRIVDAKTAALFAAAAQAGAVVAGGDARQEAALEAYGRNLGLAFQLVDDALDYGGRAAVMGKSAGDDFREGKITMPVLIARECADAEEMEFWRRAMGGAQNPGDFERALSILAGHDAIAETLRRAQSYADAAKAALAEAPRGRISDLLADLADFCVGRAF
jgi:octaprenyl-diphosphate synthase